MKMSTQSLQSLIELPPGDFTFGMIKPDGYLRHRNDIMEMIDAAGLESSSSDRILTLSEARGLYYEHVGREYYDRLISFTTSGHSRLLLMVGSNAVEVWRGLMAEIRSKWASQRVKHENVVHGADTALNAFREVQFLF
jgi:nucleoside diphosphate kinase